MKSDARTAAKTFMDLMPVLYEDTAQVLQFTPENDDAVIHDNLRFAENIFPQSGLMLCPISHVKSKYISQTCEKIFGYSQQELLSMELPQFFGLIHPDDMASVQQCLNFIKNLEPYNPAEYRFLMHYRIRHKDGNYIPISDEKMSIRTVRDRYICLMIFKNISDDEKFNQVTLDVYRNSTGSFIKSYAYNPQLQEKFITPRQHDIVKLIVKGYSNQEIADRLHVSVYTVKNHKQTLFRKVKVKNSLELANYVRRAT